MSLPPMGVTIYGRPQGGTPGAPASLELVVHHPNGGRAVHRMSLWDHGDQLAHDFVHSGDQTTRGILADWADENAEHFQAVPAEYRPYIGQLIRRGHRYPPEPPVQLSRRETVKKYGRVPADELLGHFEQGGAGGTVDPHNVADQVFADKLEDADDPRSLIVRRDLSHRQPGALGYATHIDNFLTELNGGNFPEEGDAVAHDLKDGTRLLDRAHTNRRGEPVGYYMEWYHPLTAHAYAGAFSPEEHAHILHGLGITPPELPPEEYDPPGTPTGGPNSPGGMYYSRRTRPTVDPLPLAVADPTVCAKYGRAMVAAVAGLKERARKARVGRVRRYSAPTEGKEFDPHFLAHPDDANNSLVYADFLQDHGKDAHAEVIRHHTQKYNKGPQRMAYFPSEVYPHREGEFHVEMGEHRGEPHIHLYRIAHEPRDEAAIDAAQEEQPVHRLNWWMTFPHGDYDSRNKMASRLHSEGATVHRDSYGINPVNSVEHEGPGEVSENVNFSRRHSVVKYAGGERLPSDPRHPLHQWTHDVGEWHEPEPHEPLPPFGDSDRRLWVLNHEPLYRRWQADPEMGEDPLEDGHIDRHRDEIDAEIRRQPGNENYPNRMSRTIRSTVTRRLVVKRYGLVPKEEIKAFTQQGQEGGQYDPNNTADLVFADKLADHSDPREAIVRRDLEHRGASNAEFMFNHRQHHRRLGATSYAMGTSHPSYYRRDFPDGSTVTFNPWGHEGQYDNLEDTPATSYEITWDTPHNVYYGAFSPEEAHNMRERIRDEIGDEMPPVTQHARRLSSKKYGAYRAPAGGAVVRGTSYRGGEMIPDLTGSFANPPIRKSENTPDPTVSYGGENPPRGPGTSPENDYGERASTIEKWRARFKNRGTVKKIIS